MGNVKLRGDIPINLSWTHQEEATRIRNKLLSFRFRTLRNLPQPEALVDRGLEPRLNQVLTPLMSVMRDPKAADDLKALARQYQEEMAIDRSMDIEGKMLKVIHELQTEDHPEMGLSITAIASRFAERYGPDFNRKITPHWVGYVIRRRLGPRPSVGGTATRSPPPNVPSSAGSWKNTG
jgi:hypothetical protein